MPPPALSRGTRRRRPGWAAITAPLLPSLALLLLLLLAQAAAAFKLPPLGSQRERPTPPPEPERTPKVLVAGATGRVGRLVVQRLLERGYSVVALARDPEKAREAFGRRAKDGPLTVATADVTDAASLVGPMRGCVACVSCVGPSRITRPTDLLLALAAPFLPADRAYAKDHPHHVNYRGMQNLLAAVKAAGVPKFIRVSGLSVGYSAFNPVTILLNLVVSFAVRWQLKAEQALRDSGIDYTVIRPGALVDAEATPEDLVVAGDGQGVPVGRISRQDVASLCVTALESAKARHATLSCVSSSTKRGKKQQPQAALPPLEPAASTVAAVSKTPRPPSDDALWAYKLVLRREGRPDETPLRGKPHRLAVAFFVVAVSAVAAGAGALVAQGLALVLERLRPPAANAAAPPSSSSSLWRRPPKQLGPLQK